MEISPSQKSITSNVGRMKEREKGHKMHNLIYSSAHSLPSLKWGRIERKKKKKREKERERKFWSKNLEWPKIDFVFGEWWRSWNEIGEEKMEEIVREKNKEEGERRERKKRKMRMKNLLSKEKKFFFRFFSFNSDETRCLRWLSSFLSFSLSFSQF